MVSSVPRAAASRPRMQARQPLHFSFTLKNDIYSILCDTHSLEEALHTALKTDTSPFILGGAEIYKQALKIADKLELTFVHQDFDADAFFPEIDLNIWEETDRTYFEADEQNKFNYSFVTFKRKNEVLIK